MSVEAGPARALSWLLVSLAAAGLAAATVLDPVGRLLVLPAAVIGLTVGLRDLLLRPVLHADQDGLAVVDGLHRVRTGWPDVHRLRVVTDRRTALLEIDLEHTIIVLSRRRLGRPPADVLADLDALRP